MTSWAKPKLDRKQTMLFSPTIDDRIPDDHPVRLYEELLLEHDWREWEADYDLQRGQPPIHPRLLAGAILYGLSLRIESSRQLEDACGNRLDFMWLVGGRQIDHSTFAHFRAKYSKRIEGLFASVCRLAREMGAIDLTTVATDGTRIQADSSRFTTKGADEISQWLRTVEQKIAASLTRMADNDAVDDELYGTEGTPSKLPPGLRKLHDRKRLLEKAKEAVLSIEQRRHEKGDTRRRTKAKVPLSDPDARILENKEGGWAANYTPVITTDSKAGFIIDAEVTNSTAEAPIQSRAADRIEEMFGTKPTTMLGDGLYGDLENAQHLEEKGITLLTPVKPTGAGEDDVAYRHDPTTPLPGHLLDKLHLTKAGRYTREAFLFDREKDCFYCPLGKTLSFHSLTSHKKTTGGKRYTRVYKSSANDCRDCPRKKNCITPQWKYRRVERMDRSEVLDRVAERMKRPKNKELFGQRAMIAETPFAHIKHHMGIRRFLHRGLKKVNSELLWICTAYNFAKLVRMVRADRGTWQKRIISGCIS